MAVEPEQSGYVEVSGSGDVLPVRTLLNVLWRRMWVILLVAVLLTALAVGNSLSQQPLYQATSTILIGQREGIIDVPADAVAIQDLAPTLAEVITSRPIAIEVIEKLELRDTNPEVVAANTSAVPITSTQFIEITYTDTSPERAKRVADAIGTVFVKRLNEETPTSSSISAKVWEKATMPTAPSDPDTLRSGVLALLIGLLLGAGLAFLLEYRDDGLRSLEELERICGVPIFGIIPKHKTPSKRKSTNRK